MDTERRAKLLERMRLVADDMESDARSFDGRPFTGATVGELHGNLCAAVKAIAVTVAEVLEGVEP